MNPKLLDEISARVSGMLAGSPVGDMEKNVKAALTGTLARLDLVTREEFDVQAQVLARTQEKLAQLEQRLAALEGPTSTGPADPGKLEP
jgi:ubiquinone biosynthesis accessory factor UbiK